MPTATKAEAAEIRAGLSTVRIEARLYRTFGHLVDLQIVTKSVDGAEYTLVGGELYAQVNGKTQKIGTFGSQNDATNSAQSDSVSVDGADDTALLAKGLSIQLVCIFYKRDDLFVQVNPGIYLKRPVKVEPWQEAPTE